MTNEETVSHGRGKYTMTEAQKVLTMGEAMAIQRHFGAEIGQGLFGLELASGVVWALERRNDLATGNKLTGWADVEAIPLAELDGYFLPEEIEVEPSEPETESGKEPSLAV